MTEFKASSGVVLTFAENHMVSSSTAWSMTFDAMREFFLHEQGIWRDEETGQLVVEFGGDALVIDGPSARRERWAREEAGDDGHSWVFGYAAAGRYFAAHPESKEPLPSEPGAVLQGTGPNKSILHHAYAAPGEPTSRPWTALSGARYTDAEARAFFHNKFVRLVPEATS